MSSTSQVAVVGGGILGVSTARHLARSGARVTLVTEGELASNASGRSLSWLNSAGTRSSDYHRLRLVGIDRYRTLAAQHPDLGWLRFDGGLTWNAAGEGAALRERHEHEVGVGYDSLLLTPTRWPSGCRVWTSPPSRPTAQCSTPARAGWTCRP